MSKEKPVVMNSKENFANDERYLKIRKSVDELFEKNEFKPAVFEEISPCGKYRINIRHLDNGKGYWDYIEGIITLVKTNEELFIIRRNYGTWWSRFINHQNGNDYLLCGEDYQGYVCLNLTEKKKHVYYPEGALAGCGFCWIEVREYEEEYDDTITVEGCYWGAPYEKVVYNFSDPDKVPYPEVDRWVIDEDDWDEEEEDE